MFLEIYNFIKQLFVEQTTPVEVLIIILVCVAGGMIISFILYAFFVLVIWSLRFREMVTLRCVLFPSNKNIKECLGKYFLSGLTTLIVVSTLTGGSFATGDCLPCGPPLLTGFQKTPVQDTSGADSIYVVGEYDSARNPFDDLAEAATRASMEDKRILIEVGGDWCIWCHILDDFILQDNEILSVLREGYLIVKVNYDNVNRNEAFLSKYPAISGYPHIYVLEKDGSFLHSQRTDKLEDGRSYSRSNLLGFLRQWALH